MGGGEVNYCLPCPDPGEGYKDAICQLYGNYVTKKLVNDLHQISAEIHEFIHEAYETISPDTWTRKGVLIMTP